MLTGGYLPFVSNNKNQEEAAVEIMRMHTNQLPTSPRSVNHLISGPLEEVVLKLLAKNRDDRYSSARAVSEHLQQLLDDNLVEAVLRPKSIERRLIDRLFGPRGKG
jgi:serine/threonine protein kinase